MTRNRGISLTEILVTISVIVALVGLLMPALTGAYRQGEVSKIRAELNTISVALEAYKAEFGDYPRFHPRDADIETDRGARRLFETLVGRYLTADDLNVIEIEGRHLLADSNGNPILYYPAHSVRYDLSQRHAYLASYHPHTGQETETNEQLRRASLFNAYDNAAFLSKDGLMRVLDASTDPDTLGSIGGGRLTPKYAGAYLLLSAGPDGEFGTDDDIPLVGGGVPPMQQPIGVDGALAASQAPQAFALATNWALPTENLEIGDSGFVMPPAYRRLPPAPLSPEIPSPRPTTPPADAINIMDFGANPNDGIDDSAAIRRAIEEASRQGKAVVFPEGQFDIGSMIELRPGGSSYGPGIVNFTGGGDVAAFKIPGDASDITIDGLTFVGRGIWLNNRHNNITIVNNTFDRINGPGHMPGSAVYANGGLTNSLIQNNHFLNVNRDGVWINRDAGGTIIDSNYFDTVHQAVHIWTEHGLNRDIAVTNNVGVRLERMGIEFQGYNVDNVLIAGNTFKDWQESYVTPNGHSFALSIMNKGTNIKVIDNQLFGLGKNPVGIEFAGENGIVTGNVVSGFKEGMHVTWGHNIQIQGNHFIGQTWMSIWFPGYEKYGVHNARVTGNKFTNPANALVFMGGGANGTVVDNNEAVLSGGAQFVQIYGNAADGVIFGSNTIIRN